ncbi:MAG: stage II sporulation protein R [Oscillospiraceae bacterium]|nr:stage II sporulation protein R [Oscillospiraceae bacterium]
MKRECSRNLRAWEVAILMALSFTLCVGLWAQRTQDAVSAQVLRLHVLAVDDTAEEQALKLRVRDAVLSYLEPTLEGVEDRDAAREIVANHLQQIAEAAAVASEGRSVQVSLGEESYPLRRYESMVLPAGRYESLRVVLGEGRGQNWWCVVFPPICLSAAEMDRAQETMGAEEFALVTEADGYELRFRIVELWGELQRWFENR